MTEVSRRLLLNAIDRLGRRELAKQLDVPVGILDDWTSGDTPIPDAKLLDLMGLLDRPNDEDK